MSQSNIRELICVGAVVAVFLIWGLVDIVSSIASRYRPPAKGEDGDE
jgi:hypothetical protein